MTTSITLEGCNGNQTKAETHKLFYNDVSMVLNLPILECVDSPDCNQECRFGRVTMYMFWSNGAGINSKLKLPETIQMVVRDAMPSDLWDGTLTLDERIAFMTKTLKSLDSQIRPLALKHFGGQQMIMK